MNDPKAEAAYHGAERHHHSRKAMECVHTYADCCVECCEPGGAFETFARPTTEGIQP